ncbi:MAG TPA: hypothetical protein VF914_05730 [Chloroflexia bacterium]
MTDYGLKIGKTAIFTLKFKFVTDYAFKFKFVTDYGLNFELFMSWLAEYPRLIGMKLMTDYGLKVGQPLPFFTCVVNSARTCPKMTDYAIEAQTSRPA